MPPSQQPSASALQHEMLEAMRDYRRRGGFLDMPPLRKAAALALFILCLAVTAVLWNYLWQHAQVSLVTTAAEQGNLGRLKTLTASRPALLDAAGYLGRTPFWWAAASGRTAVMDYGLQHKVAINRGDAAGWTPLHAAAAHNRVESIRLLAKARANFSVLDKQGRTVLHAAATGPNMLAAAELLAYGFSPDFPDSAGWTPLHVAVACRQPGMIKLLLDNHANVNAKTKDGLSPLSLANRLKRSDAIIDLLANNGGEP